MLNLICQLLSDPRKKAHGNNNPGNVDGSFILPELSVFSGVGSSQAGQAIAGPPF